VLRRCRGVPAAVANSAGTCSPVEQVRLDMSEYMEEYIRLLRINLITFCTCNCPFCLPRCAST